MMQCMETLAGNVRGSVAAMYRAREGSASVFCERQKFVTEISLRVDISESIILGEFLRVIFLRPVPLKQRRSFDRLSNT